MAAAGVEDPLLLLRDYVRSGRLDQVLLDADKGVIVFGEGERSFPRDTLTGFKQRSGEACPLDAVWFRAVHADLVQFRDYFHKCKEAGIGRIPTQQTQDLLQWLRGEQQESEFISNGVGSSVGGADQQQQQQVEHPADEDEEKIQDTSSWGAYEISQRELDTGAGPLYSEIDFSADLAQFVSLVNSDVIRSGGSSSSVSGSTADGASSGPPRAEQPAAALSVSNIISRKRKSNEASSSSSSSSSAAGGPAEPSPAKKAKHNPHKHIPIILVPDASTALLNIYNCVEFLGGGAYATAEEMKARGVQKLKYAIIKRASVLNPKKNVYFHVYDNPELLATEDWDRVVAVFAHGPKWQFSNYPFDSTAELFTHLCGFHLHYDDQTLHNNITQWKVNLLPLSKTRRYQDRSLVLQFWSILEKWIKARNSAKQLHI